METNGSLITKEKARELFEIGAKVGVSIDGTPQIHNEYRHLLGGQDTFDKVRQGLDNLTDAGYQTRGGIGVVTKNTLDHLEEVLDYFAYELKLSAFKLTIMHSPTDTEACQYMLSDEEIADFANRLFDRLCVYYQQGLSIAESSVSNRMANLIYRNDRNICVSNGCRGGRRMLSIDKHGDIFLCELMDQPDQKIGNIYEEMKIPEMVTKAIESKDYFCEKFEPKCKECPWRYYCRGGCTAIVQYEKKDPHMTDHISCAFNRAIYPRLAELILKDRELAEKFI